jgi:threonine dehydrogenase-like Zn-dependent dehydrogenase
MGVERAVDCSANDAARAAAIRATCKWGRIVFLGEGGRVEINPSPDLIHDQKTLYGSWVTLCLAIVRPRDECQTIRAHPRGCMGREHDWVSLHQAPGRW